MILQALHGYYKRRQADADPARRLPAFGLEHKEIAFILEIDAAGTLKAITDMRRQLGKKTIGTTFLMPKGVKKTSGVAANLLWENAEYVLGLPDAKKLEAATSKGKAEEYTARLIDMQAAFRTQIESLPAPALADIGIAAVLRFLRTDAAAQVASFDAYEDIAATNPVLTLRLLDDLALVAQRPLVVPYLVAGDADDDEGDGAPDSINVDALCLLTGNSAPVERLHTSIKGVWGAQSSGANIVSFNLDAFNSYAKSRGMNAPMSKSAVFAYTTALNALLARDSPQRMQVGDASTIFWAQQPEPMEQWLAQIMGGDDNPDAHTQQVKALLEAVRSGAFAGARGETKFFVLGLAPNAARIAVRFWYAAPLHDIAQRVTAWFAELDIARGLNDPEFPSLFRLLAAVALQGKADNIPPRLGGDLVRSIFTGTPYPALWLNAAVQRCRAERQVNYLRAAAIKACLNRGSPHTLHLQTREIKPMLDIDNPSTAYRLGRLFATLEKIQEEASGGTLNSNSRTLLRCRVEHAGGRVHHVVAPEEPSPGQARQQGPYGELRETAGRDHRGYRRLSCPPDAARPRPIRSRLLPPATRLLCQT